MTNTSFPTHLSPLRLAVVPLLLLSLTLAGCGGGGGANPPSGTNPPGGNNPPPANKPPVAVISPIEGEVMELSVVTLSAVDSSDPDGDELTFEWKQVGGPLVVMEGDDTAEVTFTAPKVVVEETIVFEVSVADGAGGESRTEASVVVNEGEGIVYFERSNVAPFATKIMFLHESLDAPRELAEELDEIAQYWMSPDRRHLLYALKNSDNKYIALKLIPLGASTAAIDLTVDLLPLEGDLGILSTTWLHDGSALMFSTGPDRNLYRVELPEGSSPAAREQIQGISVVSLRDAQPNGHAVAVEAQLTDSDERFLFIVEQDGSLTRVAEVPALDVRWSPNGEQLAFLSSDRLHVANAAEADSARDVTGASIEGSRVYKFAWSPSSDRLAFVGMVENPYKELFLVNPSAPDPSATRINVSGPAGPGLNPAARLVGEYSWSPNGEWLGFVGNSFDLNHAQLFAVPIEASMDPLTDPTLGRIRLTGESTGIQRIDTDAGFRWAPDSSHVAFFGDFEVNGDNKVYATALNEPEVRKAAFDANDGSLCDFRYTRWSMDSEYLLTRCSENSRGFGLYASPVGAPDPLGALLEMDGALHGREVAAWAGSAGRFVFTDNNNLFEVTLETATSPSPLLAAASGVSIVDFVLIDAGGIEEGR